MDTDDQDVFALRNEIIGKVQNGELGTQEAEALAVEQGLGPFATTPAPGGFDPMALDAWTLPMALAWIAWRTADQVRENWDAYTDECRDWRPRRSRLGLQGELADGCFLEQRSRSTVQRLRLSAYIDLAYDTTPAARKTIQDAMDELWAMLVAGALVATGVHASTGQRTEIPQTEWHDLKVIEMEERDVLVLIREPLFALYSHVLLDPTRVRQLWVPRMDLAQVQPQLITPKGHGYMPLFRVAHWLATKGGTEPGVPPAKAWRSAYDEVLAKIVAGTVEAIGTKDGENEKIEAHHFDGCTVAYPFEDFEDTLTLGKDLVLISYPSFDEASWRAGYDDSLRNRNGLRWARIRLKEANIATTWSIDPSSFSKSPLTHSGLPGRPSSNKWIDVELERRCEAGKAHDVLAREAEYLRQAYGQQFPHLAQPTQKTVENNIRAKHRAYRSRTKAPK